MALNKCCLAENGFVRRRREGLGAGCLALNKCWLVQGGFVGAWSLLLDSSTGPSFLNFVAAGPGDPAWVGRRMHVADSVSFELVGSGWSGGSSCWVWAGLVGCVGSVGLVGSGVLVRSSGWSGRVR